MNVIPALFIFTLTLVTKTMSYQLCGRQLADMLDLVCGGRGFNVMQSSRRTPMPRLSKRDAVQYLSTATHQPMERGGIVSECCHNACQISTLESYCAAPPDVHFDNPTSGPVSADVAAELIESESYVTNPTEAPITTTTKASPRRPIVSNTRAGIMAIVSQFMRSRPVSSHNGHTFVRPAQQQGVTNFGRPASHSRGHTFDRPAPKPQQNSGKFIFTVRPILVGVAPTRSPVVL